MCLSQIKSILQTMEHMGHRKFGMMAFTFVVFILMMACSGFSIPNLILIGVDKWVAVCETFMDDIFGPSLAYMEENLETSAFIMKWLTVIICCIVLREAIIFVVVELLYGIKDLIIGIGFHDPDRRKDFFKLLFTLIWFFVILPRIMDFLSRQQEKLAK